MKTLADPRFSEASAPPHVARLLLQVVSERGIAGDRLCLGLGFSLADLALPGFRLSHRQSYLLIRRALSQLGDDGLGLLVGSRQTAVSLGLVGLGMMASNTLAEALTLGMKFQRHAGAMLDFELLLAPDTASLILEPRFYEPEVVSFYVEEALASALQLVRHLTGQPLVPQQILLAYPPPAHELKYAQIFGCPVHFNQSSNGIDFDSRWLAIPLTTADNGVKREVDQLLGELEASTQMRSDLVEGVQLALRRELQAPPAMAALASRLNMSDRTLRRRLDACGLSYQSIIDDLRRSRALIMLAQPGCTMTTIAKETGFSDPREFRRSFKRWTGLSPREARHSLLRLSTTGMHDDL